MNQPVSTISFATLPALGATIEGGIFRGLTTLKDGTHAAVIQLPNKAQERLNWKDAVTWAEQQGGQLPSRPVAALLCANTKADIDADWYWTSDELQHDTGKKSEASYAWSCFFFYGYQSDSHKSFEGAAVAVRLIPLAL